MGKIRTSFAEKVGYGFGDMSSSMFWKIFSYYLPFFYSNIFGLRLDQVALLLVVTRIWDAVSDPMMGILADRTRTRWGKYRPYLLLMAVPFALSGILLFTTPDASPTMKLVWAYVTYILMMTVYTGINVPYGAMLGVMTDDSDTKTVLSSYRMFFAYGGSFIALFCWEPLCKALGGYGTPAGWQHAMFVIATVCLLFFLICFFLTKEKLHTVSTVSVGSDLKLLLKNAPWWILIGAALCSNLFNTVRGSTVAYFFNDVIGQNVHLNLGSLSFLFYAGLFLSIGEVCNMIGVALAVPLSAKLGKKSTYMLSFAALIVLSILFFYIPVTGRGYWWMLVLQVVISIFTGVISPLVWSMYADVSDYAENRDGTASTALIFSSASMAQKFGGAFGGAAVMWILQAFGYNTAAGAVQTPEAIQGLKILMSWVPAAVAALAVLIVFFYPLTRKKMDAIQEELAVKRGLTGNEDLASADLVRSGVGIGKPEMDPSGKAPLNPSPAPQLSADSKTLWNGLPRVMRGVLAVLGVLMLLELAFVLFKGTDKTAEPVAAVLLPALYVEGTALKAQGSDQPLVFRGVSFGWHNIWPRFYNAEAVKTLKEDWGVRIVRAAIGADDHAKADNPGIHGGYMGEPGFALDCLYKVVDGAIANGCYVIVDWHSHVLHRAEAKEFFRTVATRYADCPNVIYELYNEPVEDSWADLKAYAEELCALIDSISTVHPLILMGCPHWDQDIHLPAEDPVTSYDNLMYTVHFYAATHKDYLRERCDGALAVGIPIFISECASCEASGDGPMDAESWKAWSDWATARGISMLTWSISDKVETCSMLTKEASSEGPWEEAVVKPWGREVQAWIQE